MAKQTFSVGQVLTAAQMTSLQQTAMLGGSATAKTASYTLVAADAGTVVSVNSTSATTITVNTGLFSAGDTVTIQNWGSGAVTITAGTATVNTAGSLIVPQYDGGVLYFTSASEAIYFDWVQAGATSPLTTKGDIWGYGTSDARIPIGTNGDILTADSTQTLGLKWAAPAAGGGMTQLGSTTTLSGTTTTISSISGSYKHLLIIVDRITSSGSGSYNNFTITPNALSTSTTVSYVESGSGGTVGNTLETTINGNYTANSFEAAGEQSYAIWIYNYASTTLYKPVLVTGLFKNTAIPTPRVTGVLAGGAITSTAAINALTITTTQANTNGGTIILYGVS